jgi:hypothetical protein
VFEIEEGWFADQVILAHAKATEFGVIGLLLYHIEVLMHHFSLQSRRPD